eukprot:6213568-Pleurochrysis_carterae.AAC.1
MHPKSMGEARRARDVSRARAQRQLVAREVWRLKAERGRGRQGEWRHVKRMALLWLSLGLQAAGAAIAAGAAASAGAAGAAGASASAAAAAAAADAAEFVAKA